MSNRVEMADATAGKPPRNLQSIYSGRNENSMKGGNSFVKNVIVYSSFKSFYSTKFIEFTKFY